jgi:hypothetical protein
MSVILAGQIVTVAFEDGVEHEPYCGLEDCECPDHDGPPRPAGTYITIRLDDPEASIGLWRVAVHHPTEQESS